MGILNKDEIIRKLKKGELLIKARKDANGHFCVEPDSYDLTAGAAIWKEELQLNKYEIKTEMCKDGRPIEQQPTITVQPGQMIFVVTQEEINLPLEICGADWETPRTGRHILGHPQTKLPGRCIDHF